MTRDPLTPVLSVIVCGAGPATAIGTLVKLAHERGWIVQVIATPAALEFFDPPPSRPKPAARSAAGTANPASPAQR